MNDLLQTRSSVQGGVFTRTDALECGYTDVGIRALVESGMCRRLARGVYGLPLPQPVNAEARHRQRARGLLRRYAGRAAASHHSALLLHGLPTYGVDLGRVHLTAQGRTHGSTHPEFSIHRRVPWAEPVDVRGGLALPVAAALAQTATLMGSTTAIVAADAALHREMLSVADLRDAADRVLRWSGGREALVMARMADKRSESVGESRLRLAFSALQIPVEPQFKVMDGDRVIARSDFRVKGTRLLIEFDGLVKYRGQDGADAIVREKKREDQVRRLRWDFERFVWDDLDNLPQIASRVWEGRRRAA
ncbi:MAG TPA: type IV toxin-antitoxin system AbiEi family antitoxin domain-containing protein [Segeticoccus sp.]|uniref:type IV toxin-antitoxin system AbiEi family antitoxin domain-containing protein n=1 Tax=Segeticoccus sp. TaxID=2706531 RepID=UPI002D7ED748|nr:type IV toxin-antitoxin system AbiEi family antitoxin domain-containing protein [Segeticoccus sp.]HET8600569.1 type IV toxin-antitoxin system AbiEi family antitoxin domain-containing protein [Segeticoccus sp.]